MLKNLMTGLNQRLWIKILVPVSLIVILVVGAGLWYNLHFQDRLAMTQLSTQNHTLAKAVEGGMFDALAVGDNDTVRTQFKRLHEKTENLKVFVYDFNGLVSFSTEEESVGRPMETVLDRATHQALLAMLETGATERHSHKVTLGDDEFYIENAPIMNEQRCFHCHGQKRQVLGGISVFSSMTELQEQIRSGRTNSLLIGLAGLVLIILVIWMFFHFIVNRRVKRILLASARMRQKDFTHVYDIKQGDELNHIMARIDVVTRELGQTIREILENSETIFQSAGQLSGIAETLDRHSTEASEMTAGVSAGAEEMSTGNQSIAESMAQAADALTTIAAAVDQMSATVSEIAGNTATSKDMTEQVSDSFRDILKAVEELGDRANDVDEVTDEIRSIAEQVGLLALNAKIEAARAGEAGKGFAVVAQEITELASDTNQSAGLAAQKLQLIQTNSQGLVDKVSGLSKLVKDTDTAIAGIAASVEEQNATTREIAQNINEVSDNISQVNDSVTQGARAAQEIAQDIGKVENGAVQVREESTKVNENASKLSAMAEALADLMKSFKV